MHEELLVRSYCLSTFLFVNMAPPLISKALNKVCTHSLHREVDEDKSLFGQLIYMQLHLLSPGPRFTEQ